MKNTFVLPKEFLKDNSKVTLSPITPIFKNFNPKEPIGEIIHLEKIDDDYVCIARGLTHKSYVEFDPERLGISMRTDGDSLRIISVSVI
jgi:hypothetical protein